MGSLVGKTVLITAAAQGIGRASVEAFVAASARVIATDIDAGKLADLASDSVETHRLDVLDEAAVAALIGDVSQIDVLFNCAGVVHNGSLLEATDEELDFAFNLNVKAMVRTIRAVLPGMLERCDGRQQRERRAVALRLWRHQSGCRRPHQIRRRRLRGAGHSLQRHLPGHS
jgi:2-keto-3-deoxy-L-fuconate dehydrogenase